MDLRTLDNPGLWGLTEPRSLGIEACAVAVALLLHAGFLLFRAELPSAGKAADALVTVMLESPPETPAAVPAPPPASELDAAPPPTQPSSTSAAVASAPVASAGGPLGNAPAEELAAEIATSGAEADWALLSGQGTALGRGGVGRPGGSLLGSGRATTLSPRDFSREAIAPRLQPWVDRNFPGIARMYKVDGDVTVSALIGPDGQPSDLRVESVDPGGRGFGESCSRSVLQGPRWKPKLNRDGLPVASRVTYRCKFRLPDDARSSGDAPANGVGANRVWSHSPGD